MVFEIQGKIALVTGGASGIGLQLCKELLRNGAKGITIADVNSELGANSLKEIQEEFGPDRAVFVLTDVSDFEQFENAFQVTIKKYEHVDILVNNAGIFNDAVWEKEISVNIKGTIIGVLLAMEKKYLMEYKQGNESLIVNMASIAGIAPFPFIPIYTGTKHAVIGLSKSWGMPEHYEATKIRVIVICPGATITPLYLNITHRNLGDRYEKILQKDVASWPTQEPDYLAQEVISIIKYAQNGTAWVVEGGEPAYQYVYPERDAMKGNILKS